MAKKRKYTGVTQNEDGSWSYRLKVKLPDKTIDTKIRKDENGQPFLTARAAYEARKEHESKVRDGSYVSPSAKPKSKPKHTLQSVYDDYLTTEGKTKAPATLRKQDSMWKNHVAPAFGSKEINEITIVDLQDFLFNIYQTHSYRYTEAFLKFFYLLFGHADRMEVIEPERYNQMFVSRNKRLTMPKMTQADAEDDMESAVIYDDDELRIIENAFQSEDGNLLMAFYLGLYAGLRISECFALRWQDINWTEHTMHISRQMNYVDGQITLCAVKTLASVRTVLIPSVLFSELEFQYSLQKTQQERMGNAYRNTERVYDDVSQEWLVGSDFVNRKKNGELLTTNSMKYWAKKITPELKAHADRIANAKKSGHPDDIVRVVYKEFKFHNLRHTYASSCAAVNMSIQMLMSMMGHKKIDTTRKYYINTDNDSLKMRTQKLLDEMYRYRKE